MNDDQDWRQRGACRAEDPELFHPVGKSGPALAQLAEAKEVCGWCPVRQECLDYALRVGVEYGVFGGMSEDERRALRRQGSRPKPRPKQPPGSALSRHSNFLETARQGQDAIRAGMSIREAAATFGVSQDTARRWRRTPLEDSEVAV